MPMLSNKPYLIRAFYEWILDSGCTPVVVLNANHPKCRIPVEYAADGEIVFNISPSAIRDLKITNSTIEFKASFTGVIRFIVAPIAAINGIFAEEYQNEGLFFDQDSVEEDEGTEGVQLRSIDGVATAYSQDPHAAESIIPNRERPVLRLIE